MDSLKKSKYGSLRLTEIFYSERSFGWRGCFVGVDRFKHHARDIFINLFLVKTERQETGDDEMHNILE